MKFVTVRETEKSSLPKERQRVSTTPYRIACKNSEMGQSTPDPPYWWDSSLKVRCIDWKFRLVKNYDNKHFIHHFVIREPTIVNI